MKKEEKNKKIRKIRRTLRTRKKIMGDTPRLSVFRSNKHIYAQIIDDKKGVTLASATEKDIEVSKLNKTQIAEELGKAVAKKAIDAKIRKVVFDKGSFRYHGRVKALAEGARKEGLQF